MDQSQKSHARWVDVYRDLSAEIASGAMPPGTELPTLAALAVRENLTAHGARRVMGRLQEKGLVQGWQGKGYCVALPRLRFRLHQKRPVFGDTVRELGFTCSSALMTANIKSAPRSVASRFGCPSGTRVLATETLRNVAGRPFAVSMDFFVRDRLRGIDTTLRTTGSISKALAQHGVDSYERDYTLIESRLPTAHEALLLEIPRHQPIYETTGANIDRNGTVIQVSRAVLRADRVTYEF